MKINHREISCVVIGTSAGGVDALNSIFKGFSAALPVPILIVIHVSAHAPFIPNAFLSGPTAMRICEAEDKEKILAQTVYFAPADYHLLVESNGSLSLLADDPVCFARPSIDVLFESAALVYGQNLLGILLTGANADGSEGLKKIHEAEGVTWVQNPAEARYPEMPRSALKLFKPDLVLDIAEIGELLAGQSTEEPFKGKSS
jgi:two-component system chemotaxis response regulator CheB